MKEAKRLSYPAVFTYVHNREIAVVFPDLNSATSGVNESDALLSAKELLICVLLGLKEDGESIPTPSSLNKIKISKNQCTLLVDVYMPSIRLAQANRSVNRTVTLPAWLNAAALERGMNFSQILQEALRNKLEIKE